MTKTTALGLAGIALQLTYYAADPFIEKKITHTDPKLGKAYARVTTAIAWIAIGKGVYVSVKNTYK